MKRNIAKIKSKKADKKKSIRVRGGKKKREKEKNK